MFIGSRVLLNTVSFSTVLQLEFDIYPTCFIGQHGSLTCFCVHYALVNSTTHPYTPLTHQFLEIQCKSDAPLIICVKMTHPSVTFVTDILDFWHTCESIFILQWPTFDSPCRGCRGGSCNWQVHYSKEIEPIFFPTKWLCLPIWASLSE